MIRWVPAPIARLRASQVNLLLEVLVAGALFTGAVSWTVGTGWARWWTAAHALCGLSILALAPAKAQRSVRTGLRRRRRTRWLSIAFGVLVWVVVLVGIAHATGLWVGVGFWSPLWIHVVAAASLVPLFVWHVVARPAKLRLVDIDRRMLVGGATMAGVAVAAYGVQEFGARALGLRGRDRRSTGSHEIASFDPENMPGIYWLNDTKPSEEAVANWALTVAGRPLAISDLRRGARPVTATLDCTGGWWSTQSWDAVSLSALVSTWDSRSIRVTSITGFTRLLPIEDADHLYLAVGYSGIPLSRRHGAPVRLVAPGRRGPWWVKWVMSVEPDDRPWWLQLPYPLT